MCQIDQNFNIQHISYGAEYIKIIYILYYTNIRRLCTRLKVNATQAFGQRAVLVVVTHTSAVPST